LRKQREEGKKKRKREREERELQKIREEVFRATREIYIEPLASRPPFAFQESSESCEEERNIKRKIIKALQHAATMGEGLEETLQGLRRHFCPLHLQCYY
jgi:hypothetical protein